MLRTIAVTNQKGGSGKTTTAVSLAAALGERGAHVLLLDLDPQGSASGWLGGVDGTAGDGMDRVLRGEAPLAAMARESSAPGVRLVPTGAALADAERLLATRPHGEQALAAALAALPAAGDDAFDFVLLDCPPTNGPLARLALVAAHELVAPVEAHLLALQGLVALLQTVDELRAGANPWLHLTGILPCRVDGRTAHGREIVAELRAAFGHDVFDTVIRENVTLAEAPGHSLPITRFAPSSHGAEDYRAAAAELEARRVKVPRLRRTGAEGPDAASAGASPPAPAGP